MLDWIGDSWSWLVDQIGDMWSWFGKLEPGSKADWLALVVTIIGFALALGALRREFREARSGRLDALRAGALPVRPTHLPDPGEPKKITWTVTIKNDSPEPIFDLRATLAANGFGDTHGTDVLLPDATWTDEFSTSMLPNAELTYEFTDVSDCRWRRDPQMRLTRVPPKRWREKSAKPETTG